MTQNRSEHEPFDQEPSPPAQASGQNAPLPGEGRTPSAGDAQTRPGTASLPGYDGGTAPAAGTEPKRPVTRAGMIWAAVASALAVLVLLIVFILQNQELVQVKFFGLEGAVALGIALFIAAVGGGVLVAMAGAARIIQLRAADHRRRASAARRR
ncbi:lipopolysaccharide assembly LapA domain-containing protein [Arthrobacter sp. ZGTC131]|uniref:LapA family protein n=1 Tax=Arthrobacter sp. ZGTC131 TaxID=2058898 RepID=UPI000CE489F2|nr:lipopolysaccharide assembly protein LapA domain-containing protein [Arthrobacter sp. ZGTC131]